MQKTLFPVALLLLSLSTAAQVTDPMITQWWFNTNGNKYNSILTDVEAVYYNTQNVYVKTSGVPNYYQDGVSHNNAKDLKAIWVIPRVPSPSPNPTGIQGGQNGIMLDGSVSFTPGDAQSYNNAGVWNRLAYYFEGMDMDIANGHSTPTNWYHHHFDNLKLHDFDSTKHSPIVGYAWDGYPIYGPYGYANTNGSGGIKRITSGYQLQTYTTRTNGPNVSTQYPMGCFIEDWVYTASSGDLDEHNGRFCVTPEYPAGTYAYFTTLDAGLKPVYPYFVGPTFYGAHTNTNLGMSTGVSSVPGGTTRYMPTTSVSEAESMTGNIELYPVPVQTSLTVKLNDDKAYDVTIYDAQGKVVITKSISLTADIDMSNCAYGVYFVNVANKAAGTGVIKRIVKQ